MKNRSSRHSVTLFDVAPTPFFFVFIGIPLAIVAVTIGAILLAIFLIRRAKRARQAESLPTIVPGTENDGAKDDPQDTAAR